MIIVKKNYFKNLRTEIPVSYLYNVGSSADKIPSPLQTPIV
jgi:hypothetical protein